MNLISLEIRETILRELEALKGQRMQLLNSSTIFELVDASSESIYLHRYINAHGSYHVADIGKEFWRIIRHIEVNGTFELGGTTNHVFVSTKYVITILKNMPTLFHIESDMLTGMEIVRFAAKVTKVAETENVKSKLMDDDKLRVTAIVGAGAAIELGENEGVTTAYITKQLLEKTESGAQELLKTIQRNLPKEYNNNFENYFYVVEKLVTYDTDWLTKHKNDTNPFSPFVNPRKITPQKDKIRPRNVLLKMYLQLMDTIHQYDEYFVREQDGKLKWYSEFWNAKNKLYWDIFTFNYDTTIETCLSDNYIDGYMNSNVNTQSFSPIRYLTEFHKSNKHTINHVHGCLLYSGNEQNFKEDIDIRTVYSHNQRKWKTYEANRDYLEHKALTKGQGQSGEFIAQDSIITGLHKTDKIVCHPYAFYRTQLDKQLINNNRLLIVGYSFNDFYINIMLESLAMYHETNKIVIVDFISSKDADIEQFRGDALGEYFLKDKGKKYMQHFVEAIINKGEAKVEDNVWNQFNYDNSNEKYIVSKDGQVMFFYGGFKEATQHKEAIFEFFYE